MDRILTLFFADYRVMRGWFAVNTPGRIIVVLLFTAVLGGIAWGVFTVSGVFFRMLVAYESFGKMTADYVIHASIVVLLLLATGSAVVSSAGSALSRRAETAILMTLPVPRGVFAARQIITTALADFALLVFVFVPIAVSYAGAFGLGSAGFVLRCFAAFVSVAGIGAALGSGIAVPILRYLPGREYRTAIGGFLVFFGLMTAVLKGIFPPETGRLFDASAQEFLQLFTLLPLNSPLLPTGWIARTVTGGDWMVAGLAVCFTAGVGLLSYAFQRDFLLTAIAAVRSGTRVSSVGSAWRRSISTGRFPVVSKDILSVLRLPSETGYGLFLLSVAAFFFLSVAYGTGSLMRQREWQVQFVLFSFAWFMFFAEAYLLRFVFPSLSREGKAAWFLFTQPYSRHRLLASKILFAVFAAVPLILCAVCVWFALPFASGFRLELIIMSALSCIVLSLSQALLGCIFPDYTSALSPEKISTSGAGLAALAVSVVCAARFGMSISDSMSGRLPFAVSAIAALVPSVFFVFVLYGLAKNSLKHA